jgi:DNA-binding NarL/FixJ family response regulator
LLKVGRANDEWELVALAQPQPTKTITVLIADDDAVARSILAALIEREPTFELAGVASDADEAVEVAKDSRPDVAVLDWSMPAGGGPEAARRIAKHSKRTRVVALSGFDRPEMAREMVAAGASRVLAKGEPVWRIVGAIRAAASGA